MTGCDQLHRVQNSQCNPDLFRPKGIAILKRSIESAHKAIPNTSSQHRDLLDCWKTGYAEQVGRNKDYNETDFVSKYDDLMKYLS